VRDSPRSATLAFSLQVLYRQSMGLAALSVLLLTLAVSRAATAQGPASWLIADAPITSVGANEEFARIISGTFFGDGAFVIGDVMNARVAVFNAQGRLERMIGRSGGGPGEFQNLAWARSYRGDSIVTYDRAQRRVTVFSRSGHPARSVIITSPGNGLGPEALALLHDGRIVVQATRAVGAEAAPPGIHVATMELWIYSSTGAPLRRVAGNLVALQWVKLASPRLLMPRPFAVVSLIASRDSSVVVADSADAPIRELSVAGQEVRRFGERRATRTPSSSHVAAYREDQLVAARRSNDPNAVSMQTRILDATPFPEEVPSLRRMFVDREGRLWVEEYPEPRARRQRLRVYAPDGRLLSHVLGPDRGRVLDALGTRVLVAGSDEDGVPYVRIHQIQTP
jgi:hypothetical protein